MLRRLRRRLETSPVLLWLVAAPLAAWIWFAYLTSRWTSEGKDELRAELARGPVILLLWHEHLTLGARHWPRDAGRLTGLSDHAPAARVASLMQRALGSPSIVMPRPGEKAMPMREPLQRIKEGTSMALTVDGPKGPARQVKDAALDWARVSGRPVFVYAFGGRRQWRIRSWDRTIVPRPFDRGRVVFRRWQAVVPRRADEAARAELRASLGAALEAARLAAETPL